MDSYLLSGWRVYIPGANGTPLYRGRVYFYDASTSNPSAVYSDKSKATSLGTYVDIDNAGYLPAIWLEASHLYKCVVKQLIQADPETWETLWEVNDIGNPFIDTQSDSGEDTIFVNTVSDLRLLDVTASDLPSYVEVMGWFEPGDTGSPMVFKWNSTSTSSEDGHWILPASTPSSGRWEQILDDEIDPRKFGAIPDTGNDVASNLRNCMLFASEPHVLDISDSTEYKPRTVRFVRSGTYHLGSAFDFSQYTMIAAYDSAPVPVIIGDGVYFDYNVTFGQGVRVESSQPIGSAAVLSYAGMAMRTSWFEDMGAFLASTCRIVYIDSSLISDYSSTVPLTGRLVINLEDTLPSNLSLTDCIVIEAKQGRISPTLLKLGEYVFSHSTGLADVLLLQNGSDTVMRVEEAVATFVNTLQLNNGWMIDSNNCFGEFDDGYNEPHFDLTTKAKWNLTALDGNNSDIQFDRMRVTNQADMRRANVNVIYPYTNNSIELKGGLYMARTERIVTWTSYGSHTIASSWTEGKLKIVMSWAWDDSSGVAISDYLYMSKPDSVNEGDIICIENCGPKAPGYTFPNLMRNGDIGTLTEKSGPIYCIENNGTDLIDIIAPFTYKYFKWSGTAWEPCTI